CLPAFPGRVRFRQRVRTALPSAPRNRGPFFGLVFPNGQGRRAAGALRLLRVKRAGVLLSLVGLLVGAGATAQSPESQNPEGAFRQADEVHAVPDVPTDILDKLGFETKFFTLKAGLAVLGDYTWFTQNAASLEQVGVQDDKAEFRSFRVMLHGTFRLFTEWQYMFSYEYKGFDHNDDDPNWAASDVYIQTRIAWLGQ